GVLTGLEDAPVLAGSRQTPLEPLGEGGMAGAGEVPIGPIAAALGGQGVPRPGPLGGIAQADGLPLGSVVRLARGREGPVVDLDLLSVRRQCFAVGVVGRDAPRQS